MFNDRKVELADGRIVEAGPPGRLHGRLQACLSYLLTTALRGQDFALFAGVGIVLGPGRVRGFDLTMIKPELSDVCLLAPGDVKLAVEIADSTLERDLVQKGLGYPEAGILHYWVLDANARVTYAMTGPGAFGYARRDKISFDAALAVPGTDATITIAD